ncbi:fused signal recognition particle receptor [Entomoplasma freundtii]|uniref:Signal recognition particle receptor FtsY n=2 Tax=Entomoplasma freundtii TaxID=74700 RepID=A0A2K8NQW8_9MOLU|nr:signal recognition particle-docking protein FtsY [Entomoplasma freundtii]TDY56854.1 fused signal recognition particle receptor [Entomoplasma freundtii]
MLKSAMTFSKDIQKLSKKYQETDEEFFEELEEILIRTDMGMELVLKISHNLQKKAKKLSISELKEALVEELYNAYDIRHHGNSELNFKPGRTNIFMLVGVNGTGKTTSLAKIANYYLENDAKVMIIAADTFRAGAVEQLEEWNRNRLDNQVTIVKGKSKQDPSSVIFDGLQKAKEDNFDIVLIDTAGRLQNKVNLMAELKKMYDVVHKFDKSGPHEVLLTIDATTGQNGISQANEFKDITDVSGLILTKMDGTSKGGIALAIKDKMQIPVKMVGIGENVDDLIPFDVEDYLYGLVEGFMEEEVHNKETKVVDKNDAKG